MSERPRRPPPHELKLRNDEDANPRPKTVRTWIEREIVRKRSETRRLADIARLMDRGLTRREAEEQVEFMRGRQS